MLKFSMLRAFLLAVRTGVSVGMVLMATGVARAEPPNSGTPPGTPTPAASPVASPNAARPPSGAPAPSSEAVEAARRHFEVALECYSQGRYRDAIAELEQARRLDPGGKDLVYNLALVHEKLGELPRALGYLRLYLELETDPEERARTEASIARLEGALAEGYGSAAESAPSAPVAATTTPTRAPLPGRLDGWVWGTGGVAVCALVVGAVLGLRALALSPGSDDGTGGSRTVGDVRSDAEAAHRSAVGADVAFGVAAVSGVAATLLYFGRPPIDAPVRSSATVLSVPVAAASPTLGLDLHFAF